LAFTFFKNVLGSSFGRFFPKLIWSPWLQWSLQQMRQVHWKQCFASFNEKKIDTHQILKSKKKSKSLFAECGSSHDLSSGRDLGVHLLLPGTNSTQLCETCNSFFTSFRWTVISKKAVFRCIHSKNAYNVFFKINFSMPWCHIM
jgi:hypothetical protein